MSKYGTVKINGTEVDLLQQPYMENFGTDGDVAFYSTAILDDTEYEVIWHTTEEWDDSCWIAHYDNADEWYQDDHKDHYEELMTKYEDNPPMTFDDQSQACDWDDYTINLM